MGTFYVGQKFYYVSTKDEVLPCTVHKYDPIKNILYLKTPESDVRCLIAKEHQLNVVYFNTEEDALYYKEHKHEKRWPSRPVGPSDPIGAEGILSYNSFINIESFGLPSDFGNRDKVSKGPWTQYVGRKIYIPVAVNLIDQYTIVFYDVERCVITYRNKKGYKARINLAAENRFFFYSEQEAIEASKELKIDTPKRETKPLPEERVSAGWEDNRGHNIHKEDDWSKYDYKVKGK